MPIIVGGIGEAVMGEWEERFIDYKTPSPKPISLKWEGGQWAALFPKLAKTDVSQMLKTQKNGFSFSSTSVWCVIWKMFFSDCRLR